MLSMNKKMMIAKNLFKNLSPSLDFASFSALTLALGLTLGLGLQACGTPVQQQGCAVDLDCNPGGGNAMRCDVGSAACLCNTNDACDDGEYCNEQGSCQARAGCYSNDDCERPTFCDITTGSCLDPRSSSKNCSQDTHCPFGYYCDGQVCLPGCQDAADCALGYGCLMGTCVEGGCTSRLDCDFGERCQSNHCSAGLDSLTCTDCYCEQGDYVCAMTNPCNNSEDHVCLINPSYDANNSYTNPRSYCVPNCNTDEDCPMGFDCNDIFSVIGTCSSGQTCDNGETCRVGSEATTGYCPCTTDGDCEMMGSSNGCNEDGLCLSGRSCGLFNSLQCWDVGVTNP